MPACVVPAIALIISLNNVAVNELPLVIPLINGYGLSPRASRTSLINVKNAFHSDALISTG